MWIWNAYKKRSSLTDRDLERLEAAIRDEIERYSYSIRNYPAERMDTYGKPFLASLERRLIAVRETIAERKDAA